MKNWQPLDDKIDDLFWDYVYDKFFFAAHNSPKFDPKFKKNINS